MSRTASRRTELSEGIQAMLAGTTAGGTLLGGRVYQIQAPIDGVMPMMTWQIISDIPSRYLNQSAGTHDRHDYELDLQIDIWAARNATGINAMETTMDSLIDEIDGTSFAAVDHLDAQIHLIDRGTITPEDNGLYWNSIMSWQVVTSQGNEATYTIV